MCDQNKFDKADISEEVVRSLQSVKHDCLIALDSLLKCIVMTLPFDTYDIPITYDGSVRRKSDSALPGTDLLGSIAHNTNRISQMGAVEMMRSESAPCATMCEVRRALSSQQQVFSLLDRSKEYHLCHALAALLCNVYRVLELASAENENEEEEEHVTANVYQRLREKMWAFRRDQQLPRMSELWTEMDQLMDAVYCLGYERCHAPPAYTDIDEEEYPPPYVAEKTQHDLDTLFSAIDRLSHVAPRLNNQRVDMTERQANELAAASIGKIVDRLSLGRMNDQRATLPKSKDVMLRDLIVQICHVTSRSFDNQRVSVDTRLQKRNNTVSMNGLFDRMDRGRMADQEWKSPDERLFREMSGMMDSLVKSLHRPRFAKQRFQMTVNKERDMFMSDLFSKVDRLEGRRLENQDAYIRPLSSMPSPPPSPRTLEDDEEIFQLFDHMAQLQLTDQRAVYRGPSVKTPAQAY